MKAQNDLIEIMQLIPLRSQKDVINQLAPYLNPEMLELSTAYLERLEQNPLGNDEIAEMIFTLVANITAVPGFRKMKTRKSEIVFARQLAMAAIYAECNLSLQKVANLFLCKFDHATVLHAIYSIRSRYAADKRSREMINALCEILVEHGLLAFQNRMSKVTIIV